MGESMICRQLPHPADPVGHSGLLETEAAYLGFGAALGTHEGRPYDADPAGHSGFREAATTYLGFGAVVT
jgi:hypothetical protein